MSPVQSVNKTMPQGLGTTARMQRAQPGPGELTASWSQEGGEMSTWGTLQEESGG